MPRYDYKCDNCDTIEEVTHGFNAKIEFTCFSCGGKMSKMISPVAVAFKGAGFYKTDNRKTKHVRSSMKVAS